MSNMRSGQLILPTMRNDGTTSLAKTHERLASLLIRAFGGCTAIPGSGMYQNPDKGLQVEAVYVYTVAYDTSGNHGNNDKVLRAIAREIGGEAGQNCVYVQYAGGVVELVPPFYPPDMQEKLHNGGVIPDEVFPQIFQ